MGGRSSTTTAPTPFVPQRDRSGGRVQHWSILMLAAIQASWLSVTRGGRCALWIGDSFSKTFFAAATVLLVTALPALAQDPNRPDADAAPTQASLPHWIPTIRRVDELPRVSARQLLGQQPVATSFASLQTILAPGRQVVLVQPDTSRASRILLGSSPTFGRRALVAEVTADHLILVRRFWFRDQEIVLMEKDVRSIKIIDPTWNGALIGLAVGAALGTMEIVGTWRASHSQRDCNLCPLGYMVGVAIPVAGAGMGASIDGAITQSVYDRAPGRGRVTLVPIVQPRTVALGAAFRF